MIGCYLSSLRYTLSQKTSNTYGMRMKPIEILSYGTRIAIAELKQRDTNTRRRYDERCRSDATYDLVFFNGAVHTSATKLCNRFPPRAYHACAPVLTANHHMLPL
ncbi:hypothetical protein AVEN_182746-1 [Araneus ventricosus]|uniref:Uncharacterized protein n=1 Tax=Araneus ventricosus TaxID=182803 RepID=A0A4Y2N1X1_ARAVE|nr:hypothetical protein AVEN_182746-1 [Araneus ventricosus]